MDKQAGNNKKDEIKELKSKKCLNSKESKSPYNQEFVKIILSQPKRGKVIDPQKLWENID